MSGATLLAAWVDFLNLADAVPRQCPFYGLETLYVDMDRVQKRLEPSMRALASLEPEQVEAAATSMPELMGQRHPLVGARSVPTTSCCVRSCPTRKPESSP